MDQAYRLACRSATQSALPTAELSALGWRIRRRPY